MRERGEQCCQSVQTKLQILTVSISAHSMLYEPCLKSIQRQIPSTCSLNTGRREARSMGKGQQREK